MPRNSDLCKLTLTSYVVIHYHSLANPQERLRGFQLFPEQCADSPALPAFVLFQLSLHCGTLIGHAVVLLHYLFLRLKLRQITI